MKKGKQVFIPKARLIQILGEHLIKDATVGLLELVKNSYDADATHVQVVMSALQTKNGKIIIRDNGWGMDTDTFLNQWMNPAAGHKENQKRDRERTKLGRLPLGEKGVGKFAAQQIGNKLRIISKTKESPLELSVVLDWREFEVPDKDLHEIEIAYEEIEACHFKPDESGTLLEISELKSQWTETDIRKISNTLKRMKSPFKGATNFDVTLTFKNCPKNFSKYEDLETTDILNKAHYRLFGKVDEKGIFEFEYHFGVPGYKENYKKGKLNLIISYGLNVSENLVCGGFNVYLYNYEKSPQWKWLQRSNIAKEDIEELCGVSVYRDGIRIFPYGERGDDWLELDKRNVQLPSGRMISNDTIIGMVEINQLENPLLKDKTNREGLIENTAFQQFKALVFSVIRVLETERIDDRPEQKQQWNVSDTIKKLKDNLSGIVTQLSESSYENTSQVDSLEEVIRQLHRVDEEVSQTLEEQKQESKLLFNLAGTGLAAERFTHEFARLVRGANDALRRLKTLINLDNPKVKKEVDIIYESLEALRNDIRLLGPMFYVKKVASEKELDIRQIIQNTLYLQEHWLKKESVQVELVGETFSVKMREGSCMQIFNNLIDNSIFWLSRKSEVDKRKIRIILDDWLSAVFVSDSGSGVIPRYHDKVFEPFFSTKTEGGRGLGLYIAKEILEEKNWKIELISQEDYPELELLQGTSFKITFSENQDE